MKKLYIFDLDGMLLDTIVDSIACVNEALREYDIAPYLEDISTLHYPSFRRYLNENNAGKDTPVYPRYINLYKSCQKPNTRAYPGIINVLKELQRRNITLAVCSNREEKTVKKLVDEYFPDIYFKYISGYREGVPDKPDPYRIDEIITAENVDKSEVIYFGDKDTDVKVAMNSKIDLVLVTYGQGSDEDYNNSYPIAVIDEASQILDL